MTRIAVFTGTRAEYGLLFWIMKAIQEDPELDLQLIVSGTHLSAHFGETFREIEADGFNIDAKVDMLLSSNSPTAVVKSMGLANIGFADALSKLQPDLLLILGDRFEALAMAQSALIMNIPIAHIHGGELTLGAYDNSIRHAITKMASSHFTAAEPYRKRILQMGEEPGNVFNVGAPGLESIARFKPLPFEKFVKDVGIPLNSPYFLITFHPATLDKTAPEAAFENLLQVLQEQDTHQLLFTWPNADNGSYGIITMLEDFCQRNSQRAFAVKSLGSQRYLSALAHADAVIGNSSSGIIEAPAFKIPTVNIGLRQKGRLAADSVIHCDPDYASISDALHKARDPGFRASCLDAVNPYGDGQVAARILSILKKRKLSTMKYFQDLEFAYETV